MAVVLQDVSLSYSGGLGRSLLGKSGLVKALDQLSLRVQAASIYGLLGPSGCGKTTVLSCCLGVTRPDSGSVLVFGRRPGTPWLGVPGRTVGYMPQVVHTMYLQYYWYSEVECKRQVVHYLFSCQALSLHMYFSPTELLRYYGRIFEIPHLNARVREMLELVELCDGKVPKQK